MVLRGNEARGAVALIVLGSSGLAGCAMQPVSIAAVEPPATIALAPAAPIPPQPTAPAGIPASFSPPPRLPNGSYMTINSNLIAAESVWHLRSALNVAALGCRDAGAATLVANYNMLLTQQSAALKSAYDQTRVKFKTSFGPGWEDQFDSNSTRVYNFFSQPIAHGDFCIAAEAVAEQVKTVAGPALDTFAVAVLPRLEQPFTRVFAQIDGYRAELAAWNARYAQATRVAPGPAMAVQGPAYAPLPGSSDRPAVQAIPATTPPKLPYEQVSATTASPPRS